MKNYICIFSCVLIGFLSGCYSLSGISIDPNAKTFTVELFDNTADLVEPSLARILTEQLKDKVRNSTRLNQNDEDADLEFGGTITQYHISSEAPQPGATTAFNRLTISLKIEFTNHLDENKNWQTSFTRFTNYESSVNYATVKEALIEEISEKLIEDIFTEAFAKDW